MVETRRQHYNVLPDQLNDKFLEKNKNKIKQQKTKQNNTYYISPEKQ